MAAKSIGNQLQLEVTCFLCVEYFIDPVTLDCGHNFCHACILKHWGQFLNEPICPRCKEEVPRLNFKPNRQLASIAGLIEQLSDQTHASEKMEVCMEHQESQQFFCKDDLSPFCWGCDTSKEHQIHNVVPVAEAVEEYKGNFLSHIEVLRKKKEEILMHQADAEKHCQDLLLLTETEKAQLLAEFKALQDLAEEQSSSWLDRIEDMEEEVLAKRDDHKTILNREISAIDKIIRDLEEKCQQPGLEFLQDVGSTLETRCPSCLSCAKWQLGERMVGSGPLSGGLMSCREACTAAAQQAPDKAKRGCKKTTFVNPLPFPPEVKGKIWGLRDVNVCLQNAVEQLEESLIAGFPQKNENVSSDPDMDHPKRMRLSDEPEPQDQQDQQEI